MKAKKDAVSLSYRVAIRRNYIVCTMCRNIRANFSCSISTVRQNTTILKVRIQTFGGFEVFVDEKPITFKRAKSKELMAYLVDQQGVSVTTADACATLWGDASIEDGKKSYFRSVVKGLRESLEEAGIEDILFRAWNKLAIIPDRLDCDSYHFLSGDPIAVNDYRHDYLAEYEWAELRMR